MKQKFEVGGMSCSACVARVEKAVSSVNGVTSVTVNLLTGEMVADFAEQTCSAEDIVKSVESAGYKARPMQNVKTQRAKTSDETLAKLIASMVVLLALMYLSMGGMIGLPLPEFFSTHRGMVVGAYIQAALSLVVMILNGRFFVSGFKSLMHLSPNMDALVAIGSGASFLYSLTVTIVMTVNLSGGTTSHDHQLYFEGAAMIVTLVSVGKMLEGYSKRRTTDSYESILSLAPKSATLLVDGKEISVTVDNVKVGDLFVVKTGEQIPVDGEIVSGGCSVNQAYLTGESLPVDKTVGDSVSASTVNMNGYITARATKVGEDTTFNQILEMVKNVNLTKAPIQRLADKISGVFVPSVMAIALVTFIVWMIVGGGNVGQALTHAVSVLVISCPCALGLATPVAIMVGSGVGAKHGVLFKTATALETAGKVNAVVLDKTGTITVGFPIITDVMPVTEDKRQSLVTVALSLETLSEHPLSRAITQGLTGKIRKVSEFTAMSGYGVKGYIDGVLALGGNAKLMNENGVDVSVINVENLSAEGKTPLFFALGGELLGVIAVADREKQNAKQVVASLKKQKVDVYRLTGDNARTGKAVAARVGIDQANVFSDLLPQDKQKIIKHLKKVNTVAMVGDGVNDAVALREADLGIGMSDGSFVAVDNADVVLTGDLTGLAFAVKLSKKTLTNIKENLFWAFIYNVVCIPVAAGAFSALGLTLSPMIAAGAMSLSSLFVVTNALRLNLVKPDVTAAPECGSDCSVATDGDNKQNETLSKENNKMEKKYKVEGMMCHHCEMHVEKEVSLIDGVSACKADHTAGTLTVTTEKEVSDQAVKQAVEKAGYSLK